MEAKEHNEYVSKINVQFQEQAAKLNVKSADIASRCVSIWTDGATNEYMRWFQDTSFEYVIKPEGLNTDQMSDAEIAAAVRKERASVISNWISGDSMDKITLNPNETGHEVSVDQPEEADPEEAFMHKTETEETEEVDDAIANAVAKLKKKKEESSAPSDILGPVNERLDALEERANSSAKNIGTMQQAIKVLSGRLKKAEAGVDALLAAIAEL